MRRAARWKSSKISQRVQNNGGGGDQILPTVEGEIAIWHKDATVLAKVGLRMISERATANDMDTALAAPLRDLR